MIRFLNILKKYSWLLSNKIFLVTLALLICCLIEFSTDLGEIILGEILESTNGMRPKIGMIWQQNQMNQIANHYLENIAANNPDSTDKTTDVDNIATLKTLLDGQKTIFLTAEQFHRLYNQLTPSAAQKIIPFFDFLKLLTRKKWTTTRISKADHSYSITFLDADDQILIDRYPDLSIFDNLNDNLSLRTATIESIPFFTKRSFSRNYFFSAFNALPDEIKLQIINNPLQLIRWYDDIRAVAISSEVVNQTVFIGFEISDGNSQEIQKFEASTLGAIYLINQLNSMYPELKLALPEPQ
jgi:hypothetical protein